MLISHRIEILLDPNIVTPDNFVYHFTYKETKAQSYLSDVTVINRLNQGFKASFVNWDMGGC